MSVATTARDVGLVGERASARPIAAEGYIPEIDALRALAALSVVVFHSGLPFDAGWMGVWLFFVISGFAITTSLLNSEKKHNTRRAFLLNFYMRRTLRIWPLYFLFIGLCTLAALLSGQTENLDYLPWVLTFTSNLRPIFLEDPQAHHWLPFSVLWSLGVEEQFYLIWPFLFLLVPRRFIGWVILGICVTSPLVRVLVSEIGRSLDWSEIKTAQVIYMLTPAQFSAFAGGCALALFRRQIVTRPWLFPYAMALAGTCLLLYVGFFSYQDITLAKDGVTPGPWSLFRIFIYGGGREFFLYSIIWICSATLLIGVILRVKWLTALCRIPGLQSVGRVSYGLYLFHAIVVWTLSTTVPGLVGISGERDLGQSVTLLILTLLIAIPLSFLSFYQFERRFISFRGRFW
ncbi:acyltransferase [Inquilinus sp. CAU 1745]|uniref:acyltransferase family protein n=1 Tax=Inquilinus sp. CAU 1745 TaxID=3140369 RepID=UPI00325B5C23